MMDEVLAVRRNPEASFKDVVALPKIAFEMVQQRYGTNVGHWPISVFGPLGGLFDGVRKHPEFHAWARRRSLVLYGLFVWLILHVIGVKRRTGYNDFLLVRWGLLGDEPTALELIERSKRADEVGCTLCWALRSLSDQYPEFRARFDGLIPKANPEHMLKNAPPGPDSEAILARARMLDREKGGLEA